MNKNTKSNVESGEVFVWVFVSGKFPGGIFSSKEAAEDWIKSHNLTGVLTMYPLDTGIYDWATQSGFYVPKREEQKSPDFIGKFTSIRQEHYHYEHGAKVA